MITYYLAAPVTNDSLQLYLWIFVAVCALGALIAALVVNRHKIIVKKPENKEENKPDNEEDKDNEE